MSDDNYLTMARIMNKERTKWIEQKNNWHTMTGMEQIITKESYNAGFMAGFQARFFNTEEK